MHPMRSALFAMPMSVFVATALAQSTVPLRVVPGSSASYLYFPASTDSKSTLSVAKQGTLTNYAITYELEDGTKETLCAEDEVACKVSLPSGLVTLTVAGYFGTGTSAQILAADWKGDCTVSGTTTCKLAITSGDNQFVRITVACDGSASSRVQVGTSEGLCIGLYQGSYLVAAYKDYVAGRRPKNVEASWLNTDSGDGRNNMSVLLNNMAGKQDISSAHYCNGLTVGGQNGWYVPATSELKVMGPNPAADILGTFYASDSSSAKNNNRITYAAGKSPSSSSSKYNTSSNYLTLCMQRIDPRL